ncbi:MAG: isocitrate dehydrogenase [Chlamydiae bacterium CG10_big_fil_rev_8_21_14_0_10_35_9]|nr:MAG: isocitrate dehydrogenase [Chlamydiae bacterium CG10_big_fil_rev_8_21_14_0_10_35_9]
MGKIPIAIAKGDGIGPEIMRACLFILQEAGAALDYKEIEIGQAVYLRGIKTGIDPSVWDILKDCRAFLKAPITTPQGGGYKSLNVTIRTTLGLFANVRPCVSYFPYINTKHPDMDVVIIRENEEDLYCGIEYQQTPDVCESLKLISRSGSEKIIRFAFEFAKLQNRKKVTCFTKDNILKISDGMFHKVFDEIAKEYPDIINDHLIVDIGTAKISDTPEDFDIVVMPNLYGDIVSDIAAQITGSVGLCGSANIGVKGSMFEAVHGSAPTIANQDIANPSGLLHATILMLIHIAQSGTANLIHNAWLKTIEEGIHTQDIFNKKTSKKCVGTQEFAKSIVSNLGKEPTNLSKVHHTNPQEPYKHKPKVYPALKRELVGVDITIFSTGNLNRFFDKVSHASEASLHLKFISNRGVIIWPHLHPDTSLSDQYRIRFLSDDLKAIAQDVIIKLLQDFDRVGLDVIKTENLYTLDGLPKFSSVDI